MDPRTCEADAVTFESRSNSYIPTSMSTDEVIPPTQPQVDAVSSGGSSDETGGSDTTMLSHASGDRRRSPLPSEINDTTSYVDPFEGESANRRSGSVKGRPQSTVENIDSGTARPPSFIEVVPFPVRNPHMEPVKYSVNKERRDRRRRSLESGQLLNDSQDQKPATKARSEDNLLAAVGVATTTDKTAQKELESPRSKIGEKRRPLDHPMLQFPDHVGDNTETPLASPLAVHGSTIPIQASDSDPTYVHTYSNNYCGLVSTGASWMTRDAEIEARFKAIEQGQHNLCRRVEEVEHTQKALLNRTVFEWCITNIENSIKVAKDKKTSAGSDANCPPFYTNDTWGGYKMCVKACFYGNGKGKGAYLSVFLVIMRGEHDDKVGIIWPFNRKVTFTLVNPLGGENITASISTGPKMRAKDPAFQRPKTEMNRPIGFTQFISHKKLYSGGYVQSDSIMLRVIVDTECVDSQSFVPEHYSEK